MSEVILREVTAVTRRADEQFEKIGGSTRHWVRDCFLPELEASGLTIVPKEQSLAKALRSERESAFRMIYSAFETMRGGNEYKQIVLHTLDTIKPYVLGEK